MARDGRDFQMSGVKGEKCGKCGGSLESGYHYIYPVPQPYEDALHWLQVGIKACLGCAPELQEAQIEQGLVKVVG